MWGGDFGKMFGQMQNLQKDLAQAKQELEKEMVRVTQAGLIEVTMTGKLKVISVNLNEKVLQDKVYLQKLIASAVNEGIAKARELEKAKMSELCQGLGVNLSDIPGLLNIF